MKGSLSSSVTYCRKAGAVAWKKLSTTALLSALAILAVSVMPAHAQDYFAGANTDVTDTFGGNSAVVYIFMLLRLLSSLSRISKPRTWRCSAASLRCWYL